MKISKNVKQTVVRIAVAAAVVATAVGVVIFIGKKSNGKTHDASAFTHGLKVIGDAVSNVAGKGGMYAGATAVCAAPVVASETVHAVTSPLYDNDVVDISEELAKRKRMRKENPAAVSQYFTIRIKDAQ